ncbi:MAG: pyridoxamine 5'-phosphate oxidase family protein [Fibrella sp.]|nr:pyridoxamine 5'-phosphate oxidase family protein [Armatimonadota bacterium]
MGIYHAGEIAVQEHAGVRDMSVRVVNGIRNFVVPAAADFLQTQPFVVASIMDNAGNVWAVPVRGPLDTVDERTVRVPQNLTGAVGLVIMDFATRRRMRVNGVAKDGFLAVAECYANCPKYLQKRDGNGDADGIFALAPQPASQSTVLTASQTARIRAADTFFIATRNGDTSADASHRGGNPGFVRVRDERTLAWHDYSGNAMFNTLGNLETDPRAALFFPDFATGNALLLSGAATVIWDSPAERRVVFTVGCVAEIAAAFAPLNKIPVEYSPFNPPEP